MVLQFIRKPIIKKSYGNMKQLDEQSFNKMRISKIFNKNSSFFFYIVETEKNKDYGF